MPDLQVKRDHKSRKYPLLITTFLLCGVQESSLAGPLNSDAHVLVRFEGAVRSDMIHLVTNDGGEDVRLRWDGENHYTLVPVSEPTKYYLSLPSRISPGGSPTIYVESGEVLVTVHREPDAVVPRVEVLGSESHALYDKYRAMIGAAPAANTESRQDPSVFSRTIEKFYSLALTNSNSVVTRDEISWLLRRPEMVNVSDEMLYSLTQVLLDNFPQFNEISDIQEILRGYKRRRPGGQIAEFRGLAPDGSGVELTSNLGSGATLIEFWSSSCVPCREKVPHLLKVEQSFRQAGFKIFAISHDRDIRSWKRAIDRNDSGVFTHASTLSGNDYPLAEYYGIRGVPVNILVDKNGVIVGNNLSGSVLNDRLLDLLGL